MTADAGKDIDAVAAAKIKQDCFVDDGITGGGKAEVRRMKGERLEDGFYTGTLSQILAMGNLRAKVFVDSGETDEAAKYLIGNKVLGYDWNATNDKMVVRLSVNVSKKKNKKSRNFREISLTALE